MIGNRRAIDEFKELGSNPFGGQGFGALDGIPPPIFKAPFSDPDNPLLVEYGGPLTMVRATKGWYLNPLTNLITEAANNILRIQARGALVEGQRTNLITYSEQFDQWTTQGSVTVTPNDTTAPDGNETADKLVYSGVGNEWVSDTITITPPSNDRNFVISIYMKGSSGGEQIRPQLITQGGTGDPNDFSDIASVTLTTDWVRYIVTGTTTGTTDSTSIQVRLRHNSGSSVTIFTWGAQLEEADLASSYMPTTDAAVTRNADELTFPSSGHIYNTEGTIILKSDLQFDSSTVYYLSFNNVRSFRIKNDGRLQSYDGTNENNLFGGGSIIEGATHSLGMKWWSSSVSGALDGTVGSTFAYDGNWDALTNVNIGSTTSVSAQIFGHIKDLEIYNVAFSESQMIAKTS